MPLYVFCCQKCEQTIEVIQSYYDERPTVHEECGGALTQKFGVPTVRDAKGKTIGSLADYNSKHYSDDYKRKIMSDHETKKTDDLPGYKENFLNKIKKYTPSNKRKKK